MIYIIYDIESIGNHQKYIENIGSYAGLMFGKFDESLLPYIKIIDCTVVPKHVALAYKFVDRLKGNISVREGTNQYEDLKEDLVPYKDKFKYYMTEADKENATLCGKAVMHHMLNKFYYNKIYMSLNTPKIFRDVNWKSEHVLIENKKYIMSEIDACQNMQDTVNLMHKRFGIQKDDSSENCKIDL